MGRIGLAATLLLVLLPTTGRVVHASAAGAGAEGMHEHGRGHAAHAANAPHAHHAHDGGAVGSGHGDGRPSIGDPDCDYCPLLASMLTAPGVALVVLDLPNASAPAIAPEAPRLRWLQPFGLGSRGPPLHG